MKNLHEPAALQEMNARIDKLKADTQRQWGKMSAAQMLAHCSNALEANLGDKVTKQNLMAKIFGRLAKKSMVNEKPFKHGLPTDPSFLIKDDRDFEKEKQRLMGLVTRFSQGDPEALAKNTHPFFGKLTPEEMNTLTYKHLDHHLRQFGA